MTLPAITLGPEKLANSINRSLYSVFDQFLTYFHDQLKEIQQERVADTKVELTPEEKQLSDIVEGIIDEFGARERRKFMVAAFTSHSRCPINLNITSFNDFIKTIAILGHTAIDFKQALADIRDVYQSALMAVMDICDQSLLGLVALIDVYRSRMLKTAFKTFDPASLNPKPAKHEKPHNYTYDERIEYGAQLDEMKLAMTRQYFNFEIQAQIVKKTSNFYSYTQMLINKLDDAKNEEDITNVYAEFDQFQRVYEQAHIFGEVNE